MKKFLAFSFTFALAAITLNAMTMPADTTVRFNKKMIQIKDSADQMKIKVYAQGNDTAAYKQLYEAIFSDGKSYEKWTVALEDVGLQLPFLSKKNTRKSSKQYRMEPHYAGFGLGYANISNSSLGKMTNVDGWAIKPDQSTEWFINLFEHILPIYRNTFGITTGLGMSWQTFRLDNNTHLVTVNGVTGVYPAPDGINYQYSRLKVVHLTLPIMLEWQPTFGGNHKSFLAAGVEGGIKTFASFKVSYKDADGNTVKQVEGRDLNTNPIAVNLIAQAGYGDISIFAKYGLVNIFQQDKGPAARAVSLGLMLHF